MSLDFAAGNGKSGRGGLSPLQRRAKAAVQDARTQTSYSHGYYP